MEGGCINNDSDDGSGGGGGARRPASCLTPLQLYCFETSGYLLLRDALTAPQLADISTAMAGSGDSSGGEQLPDSVRALLTSHPLLNSALWELMDDPSFEEVRCTHPGILLSLLLLLPTFERADGCAVRSLPPMKKGMRRPPASFRASTTGECRALLKPSIARLSCADAAALLAPRGCASGPMGRTIRAEPIAMTVEHGSAAECLPTGSYRHHRQQQEQEQQHL